MSKQTKKQDLGHTIPNPLDEAAQKAHQWAQLSTLLTRFPEELESASYTARLSVDEMLSGRPLPRTHLRTSEEIRDEARREIGATSSVLDKFLINVGPIIKDPQTEDHKAMAKRLEPLVTKIASTAEVLTAAGEVLESQALTHRTAAVLSSEALKGTRDIATLAREMQARQLQR